MKSTDLINLYQILFYVSMILCILGGAFAILFFFLYRIPKVFLQIIRGGKGGYVKSAAKHATTGSLHQKKVKTVRTNEMYTEEVTHPNTNEHDNEGATSQLNYGTVETNIAAAAPRMASKELQMTSVLYQSSDEHKFVITQSVIEYHTDEYI